MDPSTRMFHPQYVRSSYDSDHVALSSGVTSCISFQILNLPDLPDLLVRNFRELDSFGIN